jgi:hypothetical protein
VKDYRLKIVTRILLLVTAVSIGIPCIAAPHKLRVNDPVLAKSLIARGGKVIGNYGAFTALEMDDSLLTSAETNRVDTADEWNVIRLNAQPLDTRAAQTKALRKPRGDFNGKRLHLVQFSGPVKPEWLDELRQSGAQIVSYIPANTYLIYGDAPSLARMQTWAGSAASVQWEGEYSSDLKVHPRARAMARSTQAGLPASLFAIQLITDANANASTLALIDSVKTEPARQDYQMDAYHDLVVALPAAQVDAIAAQPDVISIRPYNEPKKRDERQDQIVAGNLAGTVPSGPGYLDWLASKGFTQAQFNASGFVVDVADAGIDNGSTTPGHFGLYPFGDSTQTSRVAYVHAEGTFHHGGTLAGCDGHGTLNAHIIGNYDDFSGSQHKDSGGYSYGIGICPFVKVGSSVIFDNSSQNDFTSPNYNTMVSDTYKSGARIINNSWGSDVAGDYDMDAQTYDHLVRDGQATVVGNQQTVIVFAAGNAGPCVSSTTIGIDSPGSAKNVITVGAAENVRSLSIANGGDDPDGNDGCGSDDATASTADGVDCSSSQGPCSDGRMKPDVVAPGIHITGGAPQTTPSPDPNGPGSAISCFNGNGVCALPGSGGTDNPTNFFPFGQQFYTESSGTSHATPAVAGACALVRQFFINSNLAAPSPAMTKAFLINSARFMTGVNAGSDLWSASQGMGEINLGTAFDGVPRFLRDQVPGDKFTGTGQARSFIGHVSDTGKPYRVTLAWTDAPGSTAGAAYNNDLDLTVTIGGNIYKGNVFSGQYSTTGGAADNKNNVESVFLPAGTSGDFTVTVTAANINSDGVPNEAPSLDQDFALVIYNGIATNTPSYSPVVASYSGLFAEAGGAEIGRSGAITVSTTASGSYSGKLQIGTSSYPFNGVFNSLGSATNSVTRKGLSSLTLILNVNLDDNNQMTGTVTDTANWTANLQANRATLSAKTSPVPFIGSYTLIFPGTNGNAQLPGGDGCATATVTTGGNVKLAGSLADTTKLSGSAVISASGMWPFYVPLYSGQGEIIGWLTLNNNSGQWTVTGNVDWIKPLVPTAKFYPSGFNFNTQVAGSFYSAAVQPVIPFTNGLVTLTGGNLSGAITNSAVVNNTTVTGTNKLSLKVSSKGTFKGSVINPATGLPITFNGVFLQSQGLGSGYFLGTNQTGRILFGPAN